MSVDDRNRRESRDRQGVRIAFLAGLAALASAMAFAAHRHFGAEWRRIQAGFMERLQEDSGISELEIIGHVTCTGKVDRCRTCHLGIDRKDLASRGLKNPYKPHPQGLDTHDPYKFGCTACHGGNGRALTVKAAHAGPMGKDPMLREPHVQAGCASCHVPGDAPGMEVLLKGARLYLGLGCTGCHPLGTGGKGSWDYGPDLTAIGRRSPKYLETSILDPSANFEGSTMPSFRLALEEDPKALESLVVYLESLVLEKNQTCSKRARSKALAGMKCVSCHGGHGGKASGRMSHKCAFILEHKQELKCGSCHHGAMPQHTVTGRGSCPVVKKRRGSCAVCH